MSNNEKIEIVNVCTISSTLPQVPDNEIKRENVCYTITEMLKAETEVLLLEGQEGIGKTSLLQQFMRSHPDNTVGLFIRSSSRYLYNASFLAKDLCDQLGWIVHKEKYRASDDADYRELLQTRVRELQRKANFDQKIYYFIVDGLSDIPEEDEQERKLILDLLPFGLPSFRFILSDCNLGSRITKVGKIKTFPLTTFTYDETKLFFLQD